MDITGPRGTYDILPDKVGKWHRLERVMRQTAELYGYQEVRTPLFEHTELFARGVGDTTDIVQKEMYTFQDKGGRSLTLRPEGTAPCARAFIQHRVYSQPQPTKWYYIGPMFRYDRPQAGRYRQFHQFGAETFGSRSPAVDAEIITLMVDIVTRLGLRDYEVHLNSVGCGRCRLEYRRKLAEFLQPLQAELCDDCRKRVDINPLRIIDCKERRCQEVLTGLPVLRDYLCAECAGHFAAVRRYLDQYAIAYVLDDRLVRGLDYYTNTAFELHVAGIGAQSAVGGGGRYDGLVAACGGPDVPGIGFAIGMERLLLALEENLVEAVLPEGLEVFVAYTGEECEVVAHQVLRELRQAGIRTDRDYMGRSLKAQMKQADRLQVALVVLIGEEEMKKSFYTLRDMDTKAQYQIEQSMLVTEIKRILGK